MAAPVSGSSDRAWRKMVMASEFSRRIREREIEIVGENEIEQPKIKMQGKWLETEINFGLNLRPRKQVRSQICDRKPYWSPFATEVAARSPSLRLI